MDVDSTVDAAMFREVDRLDRRSSCECEASKCRAVQSEPVGGFTFGVEEALKVVVFGGLGSLWAIEHSRVGRRDSSCQRGAPRYGRR